MALSMFFRKLLLLMCLVSSSFAFDGITAGFGNGEPDKLRGFRAGLQWHWQPWWDGDWFSIQPLWELTVAQWKPQSQTAVARQNLRTLSLAPSVQVFLKPLEGFSPFLEASIGVAALSHDRLGRRDLGAHWAFQDKFGAGIAFGAHQQFQLGAYYLHYSNANMAKPNQGIDLKPLVSLNILLF